MKDPGSNRLARSTAAAVPALHHAEALAGFLAAAELSEDLDPKKSRTWGHAAGILIDCPQE
jgi:hypothetical protein